MHLLLSLKPLTFIPLVVTGRPLRRIETENLLLQLLLPLLNGQHLRCDCCCKPHQWRDICSSERQYQQHKIMSAARLSSTTTTAAAIPLFVSSYIRFSSTKPQQQQQNSAPATATTGSSNEHKQKIIETINCSEQQWIRNEQGLAWQLRGSTCWSFVVQQGRTSK